MVAMAVSKVVLLKEAIALLLVFNATYAVRRRKREN